MKWSPWKVARKIGIVYLLSIRQNNVAKMSLWRCHIVAMEMPDNVARTASLQRSLWRLLIRCCNNVIFATSSDVSIATTWRSQNGVRLRRRNNVLTTSLNLLYVTHYMWNNLCDRNVPLIFEYRFHLRWHHAWKTSFKQKHLL